MENLAALRAAVFSLSAKKLTGGLKSSPPAGARVNPRTTGGLSHLRTAGRGGGADDRPPGNSKTNKDSDKR